MAKLPDVLVLGGGIIGLTTAYFSAKAGLRVEVVDRQQLGREASWAGAGILPPFNNPAGATTPIDALRASSVAGFAAFSAELQASTGVDNGYRVCGGIEVIHPEAAYALPRWDAEGIAYERIDGNELKRLEPQIADHTPRGEVFFLPGFAQVRNPWHMRALIAACELEGVTLTPDVPAGSPWPEPRVRAAVRIVAYVGAEVAVRSITAEGVLTLADGRIVKWGRPPGEERPGEPDAATKRRRLLGGR